jgi:hypothetical protein
MSVMFNWSIPNKKFKGSFKGCEDWFSVFNEQYLLLGASASVNIMMTKMEQTDNSTLLKSFFRANPHYGFMFVDQVGRIVCMHTVRCQIGSNRLYGISGNDFDSIPLEVDIHPDIFKKSWFPVQKRDEIIANFIKEAGYYDDEDKSGPPPIPFWGTVESREVDSSNPSPIGESTDTTGVAKDTVGDNFDSDSMKLVKLRVILEVFA